jgi:hypothetical protein
VLLAAMAACLTGCGAGSSGARRGGLEFPSQASLERLATQPAPRAASEEHKTVGVDEWQPGDEAAPATEAEALVKSVADAQGRPLAMDAELGCVAREVARFYAAHDAFPDQQLQAHMAGVCGASVTTFGVSVWSRPKHALLHAASRAKWHADIAKQLGDWLPPSTTLAGAAELSDGKTSVFAAAVATSMVEWESKSTVASPSGEVELTGSLRTPAAFIYGLTNAGSHGVRDCRTDPRVALPRFHLTCQLDDADSSAWVGIQALPPGRVLARGVARLLIRREGAPMAFNRAAQNSAPESVTSAMAFAKRLVALVNETRAAAQLPALRRAKRQSETSTRLAPHYFASESADDEVMDQIALGLLAGWQVKGTIRTGDFYSNELSGSLDPKRWLAFMLDEPLARRVLLDPQARSIAIGPEVRPETKTIGALINTYTFYESDDHRADIERFLSNLNQHRRGLGLRPVKVTSAPELASAVHGVKRHHDPQEALQTALERAVDRVERDVEGYYIEASDLEHVVFPDALLRPSVTLAVSAAHHRYPDAAWGTLTLLVVLFESRGRERTASVEKPGG